MKFVQNQIEGCQTVTFLYHIKLVKIEESVNDRCSRDDYLSISCRTNCTKNFISRSMVEYKINKKDDGSPEIRFSS